MTKILTYLDSADARRERATPGPWNAYDWPSFPRRDEYESCVRIESEKSVTAFCFSGNPNNDAVFIAASRTEHAQLCRALRVAVEALERISAIKWQGSGTVKLDARDALARIEAILSEGEA